MAVNQTFIPTSGPATRLILEAPLANVYFIFTGFEIPDRIGLGGRQTLATHLLVGGGRVINPMGFDDFPLTWEGYFVGDIRTASYNWSNVAPQRARTLDMLRTRGVPCKLFFSSRIYDVYIEELRLQYEYEYFWKYSIKCLPYTSPVFYNQPATRISSVDAVNRNAAAIVSKYSQRAWYAGILGAIASFQALIAPIQHWVSAASTVITQAKATLASIQTTIQGDITQIENAINNITTLGGLLPNNPIANMTERLTSNVNNVLSSADMHNLSSYNVLMGNNVALASVLPPPQPLPGGNNRSRFINPITAPLTVSVSNTTLFALALKYYGDATQWPAIAAPNGLTDPIIVGSAILIIPVLGAIDTGGIPSGIPQPTTAGGFTIVYPDLISDSCVAY